MDVFKGMTIFVEVAKQQGFAPAARTLNLSTSAVSRYVIDLEDWLGMQLFQRTTRKLSLTDNGVLYLDRCQQIINDVKEIQLNASKIQSEPQGSLRVTAPVFFAKSCLQDWIPAYLERYPEINIELIVVDRFVDLIDEGIDVALRAGELTDSSLVARRLLDIELAIVASPTYLTKFGIPQSIDDLKSHNCLVDTVAKYDNRWPLSHKNKSKAITVNGNLRVNGGEIVRSLAVAGVGIALLPKLFVDQDIGQGALNSLLEKSINFSGGLFAVYSQRRHVSINVRSFIDYLVSQIDKMEQ